MVEGPESLLARFTTYVNVKPKTASFTAYIHLIPTLKISIIKSDLDTAFYNSSTNVLILFSVQYKVGYES